MTNDLPGSSSVIIPMSPLVCTPVSLGAYTPVSPSVSAPVLTRLLNLSLLVCLHLYLLHSEKSPASVILQYKLLAAILSAVCSVILQS